MCKSFQFSGSFSVPKSGLTSLKRTPETVAEDHNGTRNKIQDTVKGFEYNFYPHESNCIDWFTKWIFPNQIRLIADSPKERYFKIKTTVFNVLSVWNVKEDIFLQTSLVTKFAMTLLLFI